jgi:hypothetical protein
MTIIISNFEDIHYLNSLRDISSSILFCENPKCDISSSILFSEYEIGLYINGKISYMDKQLWNLTNEKCKEVLPKFSCKLTNNIYNIFLIDYILNTDLSTNSLNLISTSDISGIFGIYSDTTTNVYNCIYRLFYSNKLNTFILYDVLETNIDGLNYIVGQLISHIKIDENKNVILGGNRYMCPTSWKCLSGNSYGIARINIKQKKWMINNLIKYYPLHIISEIKAIYCWITLLWNTILNDNQYDNNKFKRVKYVFNNKEYYNLQKYSGSSYIIDYIIKGYLLFIGLQLNKYKLVEIYVDNKCINMYPLVPFIKDYNFYDKSNWMNKYGMKILKLDYMRGIYDNMSKIRFNIYINNSIKDEISVDTNKDLLEIDIALDEDKNLINVVYMRNNMDMLKWKKLLDGFLNQWVSN